MNFTGNSGKNMFDFRFDLFTFLANEQFWYFSILSIGWGEWEGSLFHIEKGYRVDVLWLRNFLFYTETGAQIREWIDENIFQ